MQETKEERPKLRVRITQRARTSARKFKQEFKKQTSTAIAAAFAFLVALSWREPIADLVNKTIETLGLKQSAVYYKFISAVFITIIAIVGLVLITKWAAQPAESK